jgi:hypothetical protein
MTSIFSRWKGPGQIINKILVASRQASTNLSVSIPRGLDQGRGKLLQLLAAVIYSFTSLILLLMLLVASACGLGLFPQLQGVSSSKAAIENFYLMTAGLDKEEIIIRDGVLT